MPWLSIVFLILLLVALIDAIRLDDSRIKFLPKVAWVLLIIFLPLIGSVLWFALGRSYETTSRPIRMPRRTSAGTAAGRMPMGTANVTVHPVPSRDGRSTEEQLADLEREIEEDKRRRAALEQRKPGDASN
ncbi:PLD nuclease N-terminal domain-containing protein [Rathayibacter sp. CAU 1779]